MDFAQNLTDDQIASIGCITTLVVAGAVMYLSFYVGQWRRKGETDSTAATIPSRSALAHDADSKRSNDRKAA
jgi:hypothetical protein